MAYPMIALTTDGTSFACASISLTETGLAVLDDDGSRAGFVPFDSLAYVAPTEESRVTEAPMQVRLVDGSTFGAASLSQTSAGVAVLDHSRSWIGFVPYDSLVHALPESKIGPTLPVDATPPTGVEIDQEDDGGTPVWAGDRERSDEHGEDATDESEAPEDAAESADADEAESGGVWDDSVEKSEHEAGDGTDTSGGDTESEESTGREETTDEEVLPCGSTGECTCGAHEEASGAEKESSTEEESELKTNPRRPPTRPRTANASRPRRPNSSSSGPSATTSSDHVATGTTR